MSQFDREMHSHSIAGGGGLFELSGAEAQEGSAVQGQVEATTLAIFRRGRNLRPESEAVIAAALQTDAVARRIIAKGCSPEHGSFVGVRLNINVLKSTGVAVHSIHRATSKNGHMRGHGFYRGEVISYLPVVVLRDAYFNVHQGGREGIASGKVAKHPMASIDGTWVDQPAKLDFDGVSVSFNPKRVHLFVDEEDCALQYAEHVTIMGHRAYVRGWVRYYAASTEPVKAGPSPSAAQVRVFSA